MRRPDFPTHFSRASVAAALLLAAGGGVHDGPYLGNFIATGAARGASEG